MAFSRVVASLAFVAALCFAFSDDDHGSDVVSYTAITFAQEIGKKPHFVMFFAPWCGHCKRLAPTWNQLAQLYNQNLEVTEVIIGKVDCTQETGLCSDYGVTGYPTLKFFTPGEAEAVRYKGARDQDALKTFINEQLQKDKVEDPKAPEPKKSLIVLDDLYADQIQTGQWFIKFYAPWCGHCKRLAPTWDELAKTFEFTEGVNIAKVDCTAHKSACDAYSVRGYPTLIWFRDGQKVEQYTGSRSHEELKSYVSKMASWDNKEAVNEAEKIPEDKREPEGFVWLLDSKTFDDGISEGVVFVKFFAPWCGHCKKLAPVWDDLATKFQSGQNVAIAKVDCTGNSDLCAKYGVSGYPTLLLFKNGVQLKEYEGKRDLESLHDFVLKNLADHDEL